MGRDEVAVGLGDDQLAGGNALAVQLGEAPEGGPVGAAGGADDDCRGGEGGHGHVLSTELGRAT